MARPKTPALTADVIIELVDRPGHPIVLIERAHPPSGWALPGGFVDLGETVEQAAVREVQEETGLQVRLKTLLGIYSDPGRDRRGHTVSAVYVGQSTGTPAAGDDAGGVGVFESGMFPSPLAFDHGLILQDYLRYRETGKPTPLR